MLQLLPDDVQLYEEGGEAALEPKKTGPKIGPKRGSPELEDAIVRLRKRLTERGVDAGAATIRDHWKKHFDEVPATRSVHRVLGRRGFLTPQPQKRPLLVDPLRVEPAQRDLAERHDPLAVEGRRRD